jgi:HK97 family phage major capsid protein/HK97 family phage prohead protease
MNRAYSVLAIKSVDEANRTITGIATTPTPDRMGDIVEPLGVTYKNPLPLLWQHQSDKPVGSVKFDKPSKSGITFTAQLAMIDEPGTLKDRLDEAWQSVRAKLVGAVSIGFRAIEYAFMDDGGIRFLESEVLELSLVTIPANPDATITQIRSIDHELRATAGLEQSAEPDLSGARLRTPPAPAAKRKAVKALDPHAPKEGKMKTIAEQIAAFEATLTAKSAEMDTIMDAAAEKGETLDADQKETYDTLEGEVKDIGEHLVRLRAREKAIKLTAKPVDGNEERAGSESREVRSNGAVKIGADNVPKGIKYVRYLGAKYLAFKHQLNAADVAREKWSDTPEVELALRSAISAGTTSDATNASPLVVSQNLASEFAQLLVPATIIGRLPGLRRVPFNIKVPRATQNPTAYWVGEGKVKPLSSMAFDQVSLGFAKVAGIVPITEELLKFSSPSAEGIILDGLRDAIAYLTDRDFLDPSKAATDISPASITNGVSAITPTGITADAFRDDLGTLLARYLAANMGVSGLVLVTTSTLAMQLSLMRNTLGQREFPDITVNGGVLEGIPVIVSENIASPTGSPTDGTLIVAINANEVMLADDGGIEIDVSREASLQMDSAPDSPETTSTVMVSLWQHNMVAFKAERFINWTKRRTAAVQLISGAAYK